MEARVRFDVITLFPDHFPNLMALGVVGRALNKGIFELHCWNPRDFTEDVHRTVDDRPYGGGPGMVMLAEPLVKTLEAVRQVRGTSDAAPLVFLTPHGPLLTQTHIRGMTTQYPQGCIFLCGRYEGVDQRFIDNYVDQTYCLGDFVLSGGELPVACLLDAWVRLLPGVLNHSESAAQDSFEPEGLGKGLLDCPHYTRPEVFENNTVPDVLLSGNHAKIAGWRFEKSKEFTKRYRPDLLKKGLDN
ncbi:MAG: tRNA (guanosine(37)-N1)-methyltransferase TrmD [Limnobacter sp.]|nr:tRNA (guanosine(37)-N1)-methyltransferase TrmD [Limnobacter sp.]